MSKRPRIEIAASILSADFSMLGKHVEEATQAGADCIHIDIMDGHFVPNITWGSGTVKAIRRWTHLPLDIHMMVAEPERHIDSFLKAGSNIITVHIEACSHLGDVIHRIKQAGVKAGVAISPDTPLADIDAVLESVDQLLVMTVRPGLPGQEFIQQTRPKIVQARHLIDSRNLGTVLEVDGGINLFTAPIVAEAGAQLVVAGSSIFEHPEGITAGIRILREQLEK